MSVQRERGPTSTSNKLHNWRYSSLLPHQPPTLYNLSFRFLPPDHNNTPTTPTFPLAYTHAYWQLKTCNLSAINLLVFFLSYLPHLFFRIRQPESARQPRLSRWRYPLRSWTRRSAPSMKAVETRYGLHDISTSLDHLLNTCILQQKAAQAALNQVNMRPPHTTVNIVLTRRTYSSRKTPMPG